MPDLPPAIAVPEAVARDFAIDGEARPPAPFSVTRSRCTAPQAGEIVVCAPDEERFRLRELPALAESTPGSVEIGDDLSVAGRVESVMIGGVPSNRVMIDLKLKF
ncbi:hypothetical protein B2G71_08975 [Novosphingobium sp. PC22D]|uniref:hypothetical protein n=1 Tax=Novosphingobium sp. PC22D TaxID=1962403 RepID=UPI000BF1DA26|nr:hypothetical protein [Novosphingobium sp. PC22D]PEQ12958.1 hypothetical protein B2G71_08975 [Novosphingobium sp. PC22D]